MIKIVEKYLVRVFWSLFYKMSNPLLSISKQWQYYSILCLPAFHHFAVSSYVRVPNTIVPNIYSVLFLPHLNINREAPSSGRQPEGLFSLYSVNNKTYPCVWHITIFQITSWWMAPVQVPQHQTTTPAVSAPCWSLSAPISLRYTQVIWN